MRFDELYPEVANASKAAGYSGWNVFHSVPLAVGSAYTAAVLAKTQLPDGEHDRLAEENSQMCSVGLHQCFRLYPCVSCDRITGWRVGLGSECPPAPCCSEECMARVKGIGDERIDQTEQSDGGCLRVEESDTAGEPSGVPARTPEAD